eukprot:8406502-Pyramimonas_sp.AAC.1
MCDDKCMSCGIMDAYEMLARGESARRFGLGYKVMHRDQLGCRAHPLDSICARCSLRSRRRASCRPLRKPGKGPSWYGLSRPDGIAPRLWSTLECECRRSRCT